MFSTEDDKNCLTVPEATVDAIGMRNWSFPSNTASPCSSRSYPLTPEHDSHGLSTPMKENLQKHVDKNQCHKLSIDVQLSHSSSGRNLTTLDKKDSERSKSFLSQNSVENRLNQPLQFPNDSPFSSTRYLITPDKHILLEDTTADILDNVVVGTTEKSNVRKEFIFSNIAGYQILDIYQEDVCLPLDEKADEEVEKYEKILESQSQFSIPRIIVESPSCYLIDVSDSIDGISCAVLGENELTPPETPNSVRRRKAGICYPDHSKERQKLLSIRRERTDSGLPLSPTDGVPMTFMERDIR